MMRSILLAVAAIAAVCASPAAAQKMVCDVEKACNTDHFRYDPAAPDGLMMFNGVGIMFDGHPMRELSDRTGEAFDEVFVHFGECAVRAMQTHDPFPEPEDDPAFRRKLALDLIQAEVKLLESNVYAFGISEPKLVQDDGELVRYEVTYDLIYGGGVSRFAVKRSVVGYRQAVEKTCEGKDENEARAAQDSHRVALLTVSKAREIRARRARPQ